MSGDRRHAQVVKQPVDEFSSVSLNMVEDVFHRVAGSLTGSSESKLHKLRDLTDVDRRGVDDSETAG
jgi:hypothetical protein